MSKRTDNKGGRRGIIGSVINSISGAIGPKKMDDKTVKHNPTNVNAAASTISKRKKRNQEIMDQMFEK